MCLTCVYGTASQRVGSAAGVPESLGGGGAKHDQLMGLPACECQEKGNKSTDRTHAYTCMRLSAHCRCPFTVQ